MIRELIYGAGAAFLLILAVALGVIARRSWRRGREWDRQLKEIGEAYRSQPPIRQYRPRAKERSGR